MSSLLKHLGTYGQRFPLIRTGALYLLASVVLFAAEVLLGSGSPWLLGVNVVVVTAVVWTSRRFLGLNVTRALWYAALAYLGFAALEALLFASAAFAQTALALAVVCIAGSAIASSLRLAPVQVRIRAFADAAPLSYAVIRNVALAIALVSLVRLLLEGSSSHVLWGLTFSANGKALILVDAIVGAALIYWFLGTWMPDRFPRLVAALGWIAAGARMDAQLAHFTPTFLAPICAWFFVRGSTIVPAYRRKLFVATLIVAPVVLAVGAPVLLLTWGILFFTASLTSWRTPERRAEVLAGAIGLVAGIVVARLAPALVPFDHVIVSRYIDVNLRDASADGAWPWEILLPSIAGGIGGFTTSIYQAFGRVGNLLLLSSGIGSACIVAAIWATVASKRVASVFTPFPVALLIVSVVAALPSHMFSVPLPTVSELLSLIYGNAFVLPGALVGIALAGSCILATAVQSLVQRKDALAIGLSLVVLAMELLPNSHVFTDVPALPLSQAIRSAPAGQATVFASLYPDDPWAIFTSAAVSESPAHALTIRDLPRKNVSASDVMAGDYAVVNYDAYNGYRADAMREFIAIPPSLLGAAEATPSFGVTTGGLSIYRVFANVAVYRLNRCRERSANCK